MKEGEKMRNYTTQMDAARKGIVTPEIEAVAKKEHMTSEALMKLVAEGKVAICANRNHTCLNPEGVGSMLRTKINVNLGVSRDCKDYDIEMQKVMSAVNLGAEAIMDLSSHGNTQPFRRKLTSECPAMIGTVPVYDSVIHYQRDLATLTAKDFVDVIRMHAEDGVDFVTLHCGITRKTIEQIKKHKRKMNIVSRGGSLVFAWMSMTGEENPFYEYYDEILDICEEYDVTISLGDAFHPHKLHQSGSEENHGKHKYELHHIVIVPPEEPTAYAWKQIYNQNTQEDNLYDKPYPEEAVRLPLEHTTHNGQNQQSECIRNRRSSHCNTHTAMPRHTVTNHDGIGHQCMRCIHTCQ